MEERTFINGDFIVSYRSGVIENRHYVNAAVVDATGRVLFTLGDPTRMTLIRSAAKPIQAIPAVESGAMEQFGFDEADLALMCGSHNSEDRHVERTKSMLAKLQAEESALQCRGHPALSPAVTRTWMRNEFQPSPAYSCCSGNHIAVMAGAKAIEADIAGYHDLGHPIQERIGSIMEDLTGLGADNIKWVMDGCNMYSPGAPLNSIALMYATFAQAADEAAKENGPASRRTQAMARIYNAMTRHPENIGGDGRFCSALNAAYEGALIGKSGADGCYAIGVRESADTRRLGASGGLGIALKIEDGNFSVMESAAAEILEQLQIGTKEVRLHLDRFHRGEIKSTAGLVTGQLTFPFKLRAAS
ncbi:thermolabile L-asparaginase [Xylaria sp. CBS 124048]|nr:thermolabile L-asparaginase [Xylaria sp. CBS 124048]